MISNLKLQILFSILLTLGCIISTVFASAVLAGALACAIACAYVISRVGGHDHPVNRITRVFMTFLKETVLPALIIVGRYLRVFAATLRDKFEEYQLKKVA